MLCDDLIMSTFLILFFSMEYIGLALGMKDMVENLVNYSIETYIKEIEEEYRAQPVLNFLLEHSLPFLTVLLYTHLIVQESRILRQIV